MTALLLGNVSVFSHRTPNVDHALQPKADDEEEEEEEDDDDDDGDGEEYVEDNGAFGTKKRPIDEVVGDNDVEKDPKKVKA